MPTANPGGTASEMTADHKYPNGSALLSATNVNGLATWNGPTNLVTFADINRDGNIWTMTPLGTVLKQITHAPSDANHSYQEPTFAPDGKTIVFEDDLANSSDGNKSASSDEDDYVGSIATVSASGGAVRQLLTTGDNRLPVWSPDGTRILFQRRTVTTGEGAYHLFTITPNGDGLTQITDNGLDVDNLDSDASWSPDGKWILDSACYTTTPGAPCPDGGESNIFLISANNLPGKPPTIIRVTNNRTEDGAPAMSPDGHWIYFESHKGDDDSISQIWRIATPKLP